MGLLSGLRVGDLDLDAKHPRLTVAQTVVADKGYQRIEPPKDYEHRSIPIPAFLVGLLRAQITGRPADAPVFYGIRTGTWLRNHVFRVGWFDGAAAAVRLAGLTPHERSLAKRRKPPPERGFSDVVTPAGFEAALPP